MKTYFKLRTVFICFLFLSSLNALAQTDSTAVINADSVPATKVDTANAGIVYFMRSTGFVGAAAGFNVFVDSSFVCRLNEKRYSVHYVPAGTHTFSAQFAGKKSKKVAEKVPIEIEKGHTYYIQLVFQNGAFVNNIYCQEVTKNSANLIMPSLKEDRNYSVKH
ncbi:MAG: DUF2846 domain-containing protein [Panacibacter sp.]